MDSLHEMLADAIALGKVIADPKDVGGIKFAIIPADHKVESLEKLQFTDYAPHPHRKKSSVVVQDVASFLEYWGLYCDENSIVFGDREKDSLVASLDYHCAGEGPARWRQHWCTLALRRSEEWKTWTEKNGTKMSQAEMAMFIEDNAPDVVQPSAATMMDVARNLEAKATVDFDSAIRLENGQTRLTYKEEIKGTYGTGQMPIPESFTLSIPVYDGHAKVNVVARLRYRLSSGKLTLWYDLLRHKAHERDAFAGVVEQVRQTCGKVLIGKP